MASGQVPAVDGYGVGVGVGVAVGTGLVSASGVDSLADDCAPFLGLKILGGILSGRTTAG